MKIFVSAAETSSDAHLAEIVRSLKEKSPTIDFFGLAGPKLRALGVRPIARSEDLLAMGFTEVLGKIPKVFSILKKLEAACRAEKPDCVIVSDYPEFHFRLARHLKDLQIPSIYFIPPKVWAWRESRLQFLKEHFSRILTIFPFEGTIYEKSGIPSRFVGNPLLDELPLSMAQSDARIKLGIANAGSKIVVLMPGSRPSELKCHWKPMLQASVILSSKMAEKSKSPIEFVVPLPQTSVNAEAQLKSELAEVPGALSLRIRFVLGESGIALRAADAGLVKSGTSTLEAALLGCPQVVIYHASKISQWIFKYIVRYKRPIALANLVPEWKEGDVRRVPELILENFTPEKMAEELFPLIQDTPARSKMLESYRVIEATLRPKQGGRPRDAAADEILNFLKARENRR